MSNVQQRQNPVLELMATYEANTKVKFQLTQEGYRRLGMSSKRLTKLTKELTSIKLVEILSLSEFFKVEPLILTTTLIDFIENRKDMFPNST